MPSKKKKYNARFPAGRIKKIMQSDEEIGKVAQAVPVIISRTLELFVESLLNKTLKITNSRNAKTLSTSHMKQCIMAEQRFDFLRELVKNIPDISVAEEAANYNEDDAQSSPEQQNYPDSDTPYDLSMQSTSTRATRTKSNGDFQQPHMSNRYAENGSAAAMAKHVPSHEEHMRAFVEERRAHLKRQAAMATHSLAEDMGVLPQRISAVSKINDKESHAHSSRETDLAKQGATKASNNSRDQIPEEQLFAHENERFAHLDRETAIRKQIGQRQAIENSSIATPSSSVIRHTTSLSTAAFVPHLPPKLYRTDSAPATAAGSWQSQNHQAMSSYKKSLNAQHHRRLKHQPQSEPIGFNEQAASNVSIAPHTTTTQTNLPPIPAPIVNIDFCNKPVVKIEYSNLAIPAKTSILPIAPLSAPASIANKNSTGFNFDSEPVINIDLSNIVTNSTNARNEPAVATISIGNIATMPSFLNPLVAAPTNSQKNSNSINPACHSVFSPTALETKKVPSITVTAATPSSSSTITPKNNNSFFELDEDYDNI